MATFQHFEDIEAWQQARLLTRQIYCVSRSGRFAKDFGLRDQIQRASVSIMSNIAEGFERNGNKEFVQFLSIAKGSAGEVRSLLYVALDEEYIPLDTFHELNSLAQCISRLLCGLMRYLSNSPMKGAKYVR